MDDWNQQCRGTAMDEDGEWAASGKRQDDLLASFMKDPFFDLPPPKSTGRDYFNMQWLQTHLDNVSKPSVLGRDDAADRDTQATLMALTVASIAQAIVRHAPNTSEIAVCGGGVNNIFLMKKLHEMLPKIRIYDTAKLDLDPNAIEAVTFAWLAKQTLEGKPGSDASVTGASNPGILGGLYQPYRL